MSLPQVKLNSKLKNYVVQKELGAGCFGRVYQGLDTINGSTVAIKCVSKQLRQTQPKAYQLFQDECAVLKRIKNPNVVEFVDYFESRDICFLTIEFCNEGDLEDELKKRRRIPEAEAIDYFKQILSGFQSLHELNILHRDLKLPNILKHNGQLKLADFGFTKQLNNTNSLTQTILGTPYTMAPEILENKSYGIGCDIYSLGVNFYQLVFGTYPYNARSEAQLLEKIKQQNLDFNVGNIKISKELQDLLSRMLKYRLNERITMEQIWQHPLFQRQNQNIGMAALYASKINTQAMANKYKAQQGQQPFQNNGNNMNQQQQQYQQPQQYNNNNNNNNNNYNNNSNNNYNQYQQPQLNNNRQSSMDEEFQEIQSPNNQQYNQQIQNQQIEEQIFDFIKRKYMHEINTISQIGICINSCCLLPQTQINTYYPCYFMLKKLYHYQNVLLKDMQNRKNVFNFQYPDKLFNNSIFVQTMNTLAQQIETNKYNFLARKYEMDDLMQQTPQPEIIEEIRKDSFDSKSEEFYKTCLVNYYINIQDEMHKYIRKNMLREAEVFQKHLVEILDVLDLQEFFRKQKDFDFFGYQQEKDSLNFQQRSLLIESKAKVVFR